MSDTQQSRAGTAAAERYEALFRVSQTLISIRSSEELFRLLARELRAVVNFYVMGVGIYDESAHEVRLTSSGEPGVPLQVPKFAPEETFTWWVFQHQQPVFLMFLTVFLLRDRSASRMANSFSSEPIAELFDEES
jgi:hypothetical protein